MIPSTDNTSSVRNLTGVPMERPKSLDMALP